MRRLFLVVVFVLFALKTWGERIDMPELPKTPISQIGMSQLSETLMLNSEEAWNNIATSAKDKALELAQTGDIKQATNWLYTSIVASVFAKEGAGMPVELKRIIIDNLPAFFDFYESLTIHDSLGNACDVMTQIYLNQPAQTKKYIRAVMALSLIYDRSLPTTWPHCNVADEPTQVSMPQEIFLYFSLRADKLPYDLNKLTIGELIHLLGICGPLTELETVFDEKIKIREIENVHSSIKTDTSRVRGSKVKEWDTNKIDFTLQNIKRYGASPFEKTFYAWRLANANGIPCIFFNDSMRGNKYAWLAYMAGAGDWKLNVFRDMASKYMFGAPLNPQTWRPISMFELYNLTKREIVSEKFVQSIVLYRLASLFLDAGKYKLARDFSKKAIEANPLNSRAYSLLIPSMARCGAESKEIDAMYKQSFEVFKAFPEESTKMLNMYRENLIARKRGKDADELFANAMRQVMRTNAGLVAVLYGDVLEDMYKRSKSNNEAFALYKNIMRNATKAPAQFYDYVARPTIEYFWSKNDKKTAFAAIRYTATTLKSYSRAVESLNSLKTEYEEQMKLEKDNTAEKKAPPFYE